MGKMGKYGNINVKNLLLLFFEIFCCLGGSKLVAVSMRL